MAASNKIIAAENQSRTALGWVYLGGSMCLIAEMEEVLNKLAKERTTWQTYREELVAQVDSANAKFVLEKEVALLSNRNSTDLQNKSLNFEIKSSNWKG